MVDDEGLKVRVKLDVENNTDAKNLYSAIKRGDVTGMSFMFSVRGEEITDQDTDLPLRTITDIEKVYEVSAVTFPAYEDTEINARCKLELENFKRTLDNVKNITSDDVKGDNSNKREIELLKMKNEILGGI
jgi:phage head maturation protease